MSTQEYEEIEMLYTDEYEDEDNNDESEKDKKNNLNNVFKSYIVKKIKPTRELIESFKFARLDCVRTSDGVEMYAKMYSDSEFLKFKFTGLGNNLSDIDTIVLHKFEPQRFINSLFKHSDIIPTNSYIKTLSKINGNIKIDDFTLSLYDEYSNKVILFIEYETATIFYNKNIENKENLLVRTLLGYLENFIESKFNNNKIFVVHKSQNGFDKTGFNIKKVNINLNENYNDDFPKIAQEIIAGLNKKNKTSLVILSGVTGSGKTTFIRYMASRLKKNIIFISPDMVNYITDPSFIPFLIKNNDSILIIEDAEPALETRDSGRTGAVSNILNLTDGLLSDCLNISIVATFNTETNKIDSALLRKGRLLKNYKFEKLSIDKSSALLKKLGHDINIKEPMSLSDIYYYADNNNSPDISTHKVIGGFGRK